MQHKPTQVPSVDEFELEMKASFLEEASQMLADVEASFLILEENPEDAATLNAIFRLAHNIKGSAKAVGFDQASAFAHEFESLLVTLKKGNVTPSKDTINLLLRCTDHLREMTDTLKLNFDAAFNSAPLIVELQNAHPANGDDAPNPLPTEQRESELCRQTDGGEGENLAPNREQSPALVDPSYSDAIDDLPGATVAAGDFAAKSLVTAASSLGELTTENDQRQTQAKAKESNGDESIRVNLSRLELLINSIGELVILESVLYQQTSSLENFAVRKLAHQMAKVTKGIQEAAMSLRMVKLKPIFQKMQRIVRDTAQGLDKEIKFVTEGEENEVDKTIFERIGDPLVHLVRNAVDHGIESSEQRAAAGKPPAGKVVLRAYHRAGKLMFEIEDDGAGLDPEKLTASAIRKKLIPAGSRLSAEEAQRLIFLPGFSSKSEVTDVSGRGVGMDVVKTNVTQLGGTIAITSQTGQGTKFSIELPLTLAIIEGMITRVGSTTLIIPLAHVHETVRLPAASIHRPSGIGEVLVLRQENLPVFRLSHLLQIADGGSVAEDASGIVVRTGKQPFVIAVDEIVSSMQVVVKQLGREALNHIKGVSGSTILGNGRPALILEVNDVVAHYSHLSHKRRAA